MSELMDNQKKDEFEWVDVIIAERKKKNWTQANLAAATGLTRTTISDYEKRERTEPNVKALSLISVALGFPPDYLPKIAYPFLRGTEVIDIKALAKVKNMLKDLPPNEQDQAVKTFDLIMKQLKRFGDE